MIRFSSYVKKLFLVVSGLVVLLILQACSDQTTDKAGGEAQADGKSLSGANVLVFSKTDGERHESIPAGIEALKTLARDNGFTIQASEDPDLFTDAALSQFNAVVFLNTSNNLLNEPQELAMERYIQAGGGFVGIHAAAETEWQGDWFWYRKLVGAVSQNHSGADAAELTATVHINSKDHASTETLPDQFELADELYSYREIYQFINVVASVNGAEGENHPVSWYHDFDGGRSFYTGLGHSAETFTNENFLQHLLGGIHYAVGLNHRGQQKPQLDYSKSRPENNRFIKKTLVEGLNEPVKFDFFPNGDALIALRPGEFVLVDYKTGESHKAGTLAVEYKKIEEWGLVGVAVDPDFANTNWIYAAFNVKDDAENYYQKLSRFQWKNNQVDESSEQEILRYGIDHNCCHTGGDLRFGQNGELFFSTGDNTNPHDQDGYAPLDFRPDMKKNDGLRAPGNTRDLRGKVLRIKPNADGSYDIPAGNLFTDAGEGRPEIYVMGARNPYSITVDKKTNTLFYGDVGPDANVDSDEKGVRGYDEINRVTAAGNFGWPMVIGQNRPYKMYDYINKKGGETVDVNAPMNISPSNTGAKQLPPAQPAFIAYPYAVSEVFPELGAGGRTALVADVYRANEYPESVNRYPGYYDNKLFIAEFMRAWVKVVSFDDQGRIIKIEPFAPQINYSLPIASRFAPDGTLYVLEYGMSWFTGNPDARLARIEYVGSGNRPPLAAIAVNKNQAGLPATIEASAAESVDLDGDKITYRWTLVCVNSNCESKELGDARDIQLPFATAGIFRLDLQVTDVHGATATASQHLEIGNEPATIELVSEQNKSFFWGDTTSFSYQLVINDQEDGTVSAIVDNNPNIQFTYNAAQQAKSQGHQLASAADQAKSLLDANSCLSCHKMEETVVGPALRDVAKKYQNDPKAMDYLINKIGNGGSGVWGEMNMPAFAGLGEADLNVLATYVLSLNEEVEADSLPLSGQLSLGEHQATKKQLTEDAPFNHAGEAYLLQATYTDKPVNGVAAISASKTFSLTPHRFNFDSVFNADTATKDIKRNTFRDVKTVHIPTSPEWAGFALGNYDLTEVNAVQVGSLFFKDVIEWQFELRRNNAEGEVIASGVLTPKELRSYQRTKISITPVSGFSELYLQVKMATGASGELALQDISFEK
jgi:cytochrome c